MQRYMATTAAQLFTPAPYIATVLETPGKTITYQGKPGGGHKDDADGEEKH